MSQQDREAPDQFDETPFGKAPIDEAIEALRRESPPEWVRSASRRVVAEAFGKSTQPWWGRSVSVPLPAALATAAALLVTTTLSLWPTFPAEGQPSSASTPQPIVATPAPDPHPIADESNPSWSVTHTYLGSLDSVLVAYVPPGPQQEGAPQ